MKIVAILATVVSVALTCPPARACNPDEGCNVCIVPNPFGGCVQYGNDPTCEARKAICQQCASIKATATGASYACAACVMISGPEDPACIAVCGGAAEAQAVSAAGSCD